MFMIRNSINEDYQKRRYVLCFFLLENNEIEQTDSLQEELTVVMVVFILQPKNNLSLHIYTYHKLKSSYKLCPAKNLTVFVTLWYRIVLKRE